MKVMEKVAEKPLWEVLKQRARQLTAPVWKEVLKWLEETESLPFWVVRFFSSAGGGVSFCSDLLPAQPNKKERTIATTNTLSKKNLALQP